MLSMSSELSQMTRDSRTFLSSVSCSMVKEDGHPLFSYQKRSPNRKLRNWRPMMQAKVGPTMAPAGRVYIGIPTIANRMEKSCGAHCCYEKACFFMNRHPIDSSFTPLFFRI